MNRHHPVLPRRRLLGWAGLTGVGLAGAGLAAACTTDTTDGSGRTAPESATAPASSATQRRIVTLDPFSTYNLFDLGLQPVGVQEGLAEVINPAYAEVYAGLPTVGTYAEPNLEAIVALAPDLILASTGQEQVESRLAQIADTVLVTGTVSSTWRQAAAEVAAAVDRPTDLATLETAYTDRAAEVSETRRAVLDDLVFAMIWRGQDDGFSVRSPRSNGGQVLDLCGVTWNRVMTEAAGADADTRLSWEQADQLADADVICVPGTTTGAPNPMTEVILGHPSFATVPAVRAGRVITLDNMTPGSYRNATELLDEFDAALARLAG